MTQQAWHNKYGIFILLKILFVLVGTLTPACRAAAQTNKVDASKTIDSLPNTQVGNYVVQAIRIEGNKKTSQRVILRELNFEIGDTIPDALLKKKLKRSKENLLNTSLFNYVTLDTSIAQPTALKITIKVEERWYLWPNVIIQTANQNFNSWWKNKDFSRLTYGLDLVKQNFRGENEKFAIRAVSGFEEEYGFLYDDVFIDKNRKHSLSFFGSYVQQHSMAYNTLNDTMAFYKSYNNYVFKSHSIAMSYLYRQKLYSRHNINFGYRYYQIADTIALLNPNYLGNGKHWRHYMALSYSFSLDKRDSKAYPLSGYKFYTKVIKKGLGLLNSNTIDIAYFRLQLNQHYQLHDRWYAASGLTIKKSLTSPVLYGTEKALGYQKDFLRGYEYYTIDGEDFYLFKSVLKYELLPTRILHIKRLPTQRFNKIHYAFYLNLFFDAGYVVDNSQHAQYYNNELVNSFLYSGGVGLDLYTYYDVVIRLEYAINAMHEKGFFIHFVAPIN